MNKVVKIGEVTIGDGTPKICSSIVSQELKGLLEEIQYMQNLNVDIIEWRIDYYKNIDNQDSIKTTLKAIRKVMDNKPLLVTFRSKKEGGEKEVNAEEYKQLNKTLIASGYIDAVDVELFSGEEIVKELVSFAHQHKVKVIISNHDFIKTPCKEEIINRLCRMQTLEADIAKIAVMPQTPQDVLTLLEATNSMRTQYADRPFVTMSMSRLGLISRLTGEIFGSAITFGVGKEISAPGQIAVTDLYRMLQILHAPN